MSQKQFIHVKTLLHIHNSIGHNPFSTQNTRNYTEKLIYASYPHTKIANFLIKKPLSTNHRFAILNHAHDNRFFQSLNLLYTEVTQKKKNSHHLPLIKKKNVKKVRRPNSDNYDEWQLLIKKYTKTLCFTYGVGLVTLVFMSK